MNLLKKEFRLCMHPTAPMMLALSALILVPAYPYAITCFYGLGLQTITYLHLCNWQLHNCTTLNLCSRQLHKFVKPQSLGYTLKFRRRISVVK